MLDDVSIVLVGKYTDMTDSYMSVVKSLEHAAFRCNRKLILQVRESWGTTWHIADTRGSGLTPPILNTRCRRSVLASTTKHGRPSWEPGEFYLMQTPAGRPLTALTGAFSSRGGSGSAGQRACCLR